MAVKFELNGRHVSVDVPPDESLLTTLREHCDIHSIKNGCAPQGQCGCCLVLLDGQAKVSCALPMEKVSGRAVTTLEGVPTEDRDLLARSFVAAAGLQCGFCIPGIALRAFHLVGKNPSPSREEIAKALDVHLCRCTGYVRILDAVELYARAKAGAAVPQPTRDGGVGASLALVHGAELTLGDQPYVGDMRRPEMLHGAVLFSAHARARVAKIDVSRARALEGVACVATAADVPGERWFGLLYNDWPGFVAEGEEVRCVGDVLAAVAARDERTARAALALIQVDYEPLTPVCDAKEALRADAPRINPKHENVLSRSIIRRGDAQSVLARSAHVVSATFETQRIEHLFLEPECAIAEPAPDGTLKLWTQGQGVFDDQRQVAAFLGVPQERVFVELVPSGGAFGGKEDMSIQAQTALLAWMAQRPVKITLNREESVRMHPKRHPITLAYSVGCDANGHLTALHARIVGDSGAYASVGSKVLERCAGHAAGPYRVPNVDVEAIAVYTNNPPCGAMRGFGVPQSAFAIEGCLDMLAEKVGIDGWEIRWRNAVDQGDTITTGQVMEKSVGLKKTLLAVKDAYLAARAAKRAVGIACGLKNSGLGNGVLEWGKCCLSVETGGRVGLYNAFTEMGQGLFTVLVQFAVEVTGLPADAFVPRVDARFPLGCGQTTGSRGTLLGGRAVIDAARKLRADLDGGKTLSELEGRVYMGEACIDDTTALGAKTQRIKTHTSFGFATQLCILDAEGRVDQVVAAHDVGRAVNPDLCRAQIEGSIHMGLGYALTEALDCENGFPVTVKLKDLGVLRARDMPSIDVRIVEDAEPEGPYGAKGVGEIGLVPTAAAVAGALAAYDGRRHLQLPMRDSPAARAMSVGMSRGRARSARSARSAE